MGLRGRAKKPAEQKARQPRRAAAAVLEPDSDVTVYGGTALLAEHKPPYIKKRAAEIWDYQLNLAPQLRACDALLFADYCVLAAEIERLHEYVCKHGFFQKNSNNTKQKREEVSLLDDQRAELLKLSSALGFTPYARKQQGIVLKVEEVAPNGNVRSTAKGIIDSRRRASDVGVVVPPRPKS